MRKCWKAHALIIAAGVLLAGPGEAQPGPWQARLRVVKIEPNVKSDEIADTGSRLTMGGATSPELSLSYRLTPLWALELSGTAAKHLLAAEEGDISGLDAGSVWVAPVMLSLQAHIDAGPRFAPYLGVGVVVTTFQRHTITDDLQQLGVSSLAFETSVRVGSQIGLDYLMGSRWRANVEIRYTPMTSTVGIRDASGGALGEVVLDLNPWVFGAGVGIRF